MIAGIAALLVCQLAGEILVRGLALPIPGPVAGMGLLFATLVLRGRGEPGRARRERVLRGRGEPGRARRERGDEKDSDRGRGAMEADRVPPALGRVADALLRHLSLLFVPAAVGVVRYGALLRQYGATIVVAVLVSTVVTLVATVTVFRAAARRSGAPDVADAGTP